MEYDGEISAGENPASTAVPVSRRLDLQIGFIGLDSLYVVLEYPYPDVFRFWLSQIGDLTNPRLYEGIESNGYVVRKGGNGYKLSVWDGDARLYLTDRVNDLLTNTPQAGQGMGMMLQLGPKWLRQYGDSIGKKLVENVLGQFVALGVRGPEEYKARLNRMDITIDLLGLRVSGFSLDEWRERWVGRASQKSFHDAPRTGELQGLSIGSSEGAIRFKVYDKIQEANKKGTLRFWRSVWGFGEGEITPAARFEWSIQCYKANFEGLRYLPDLTFEKFLDVLNYVSLKWGRLCIPQPEDSNQSRWPLAPLWAELRRLIDEWTFHYDVSARRSYDYGVDLNPYYLRSLAGWFAGFLARIALNNYTDGPASFTQGLMLLRQEGLGVAEIQKRALQKWRLLSILAEGGKR